VGLLLATIQRGKKVGGSDVWINGAVYDGGGMWFVSCGEPGNRIVQDN